MPSCCNCCKKNLESFSIISASEAPQAWFAFLKNMPRPGPRPYECVKRAWHSDRHRPIRGSIIQQIFRVVNEVHCPATKKNKEWQEKLPIVVFKAEEIIYSKANSEAEYTNAETLWDRVNDAINTIIRRDESNETGELLPPCIEAALNLGCIPVRASRSQRHNNPRTYLTPRTQEPVLEPTTNCEQCPPPLFSANQLNLSRPATSNSAVQWDQNRIFSSPHHYPFALDSVPVVHNSFPPIEANPEVNLGSVYPLFYGNIGQNEGYEVSPHDSEEIVVLGRPATMSSTGEAAEKNILSSSSCVDFRIREEKQEEAACDLSLRLGLCSQAWAGSEVAIDFGKSSSQLGRKLTNEESGRRRNKEICFFPRKSSQEPFDAGPSTWSLGRESEKGSHRNEGN